MQTSVVCLYRSMFTHAIKHATSTSLNIKGFPWMFHECFNMLVNFIVCVADMFYFTFKLNYIRKTYFVFLQSGRSIRVSVLKCFYCNFFALKYNNIVLIKAFRTCDWPQHGVVHSVTTRLWQSASNTLICILFVYYASPDIRELPRPHWVESVLLWSKFRSLTHCKHQPVRIITAV